MLAYSVLICIYINFPEIVTQHELFFARIKSVSTLLCVYKLICSTM